ncbi:PREDICTED: outer dynein arm protein 1-like [Nicrophorus vespilloides]|uniref:Outer dynein arm protein 1-like n=1 Tax=Nicrophorus vespilloides TaxID=110193 RepID=A0ABM1MU08_NICVS|nr:PREDICTED: outer dynein arm protein 1-like [Nicrophorus vespilloides]
MASKEKKNLTPEEKFKLELQTETELLRLQRQYHILERDRNTFTGSNSGGLSKQRKVIDILQREYNEILTDLSVAASEANAKNDAKIADNLRTLLKEHNSFVSDIKREKAYLSELDVQITLAKKGIVELKSSQVTDIQCTQRVLEGQRTLEALENKLDIATKRFCMTLTENRKLRQEIDHLLKDRSHFNKLWDKLVTSLAQGKKFMLDLIEQATIAYDQREEWCQKLQTLRTRALSEYTAHVQEMTEMQRGIDNETKLQEFLSIKGQKRIMKNLLAKEHLKREQQKKDMQELLEKYNNIVEQIKSFTGESSVHKVTEKFAASEMENFSMFQYVIELNRELEESSDELMSLHMNIDAQRKLHNLRGIQQQEKLARIELELENTQKEVGSAEKELESLETLLKDLLEGITRIFRMCKCSNAPLMELLGNNSSINMQNVLLYLEILEKKINELIVNTYYKEKKDKKKGAVRIIGEEKYKYHLIAVDELVDKDPCPLKNEMLILYLNFRCVEQSLVSDVIDSLQKVMNKDQIKEKLAEAIEKRGFSDVVHNVSGCHLPKSRAIIQKRYQ